MFVVSRPFRLIACLFAVAFCLTLIGTHATYAQQNRHELSVSEFLANPMQLLQQHPIGGARLANKVQELVLADPSTFKVILSLLANTNDAQRSAIGEGLAQATKIEVLTNQALAEEWQSEIAAIDDPIFKTAATNAFGDVQLGAIGGGPLGGGGGGPGIPGGGNTGPRNDPSSSPVPTYHFTYGGTTTAGPGWTYNNLINNTNTTDTSPSGSPPSSPVSE